MTGGDGVDLAIELGGDIRYGYVHVAGCRDLEDPEPIGRATSQEQASSLVTGWDVDDRYQAVADCVRKALR